MTIQRAGLLPSLDPASRGDARHAACGADLSTARGLEPRPRKRALSAVAAAAAMLGVTLACVPATPARAALGGTADSVAADSTALRGQLRSTGFVQYDAQLIQSGTLTIREYVTRSGQVFAVTWQGPEMPRLQQLLGDYFGRFQTAAEAAQRASPGIHRQLRVVQPDLVLLSSGRMRDFHGIAYLPALVPAGVAVNELQ